MVEEIVLPVDKVDNEILPLWATGVAPSCEYVMNVR